jgi:hypothetical protein
MELGHLTPGDKIAKCPYCETVVDLPDGSVEEFIRESSEEIVEPGRTTRRTERTIERRSDGASSAALGDFGSLGIPQALREALDDPSRVAQQIQTSTIQSSTHVVTSGAAGQVDINKILQDAGVVLPHSAPSGPSLPQTIHTTTHIAPDKRWKAVLLTFVVLMIVFSVALAAVIMASTLDFGFVEAWFGSR